MPTVVVVLGSHNTLIKASLRKAEIPDATDIFLATDLFLLASNVAPLNDKFLCFNCYSIIATAQDPQFPASFVQRIIENAKEPSMIFVDGPSHVLKKTQYPDVNLIAPLYTLCQDDFDMLYSGCMSRSSAMKFYDVLNTFFFMLLQSYNAVAH